MIKITIAQTDTRLMEGVSKASGKPYAFRIQKAYAHTQDQNGNAPPYPEAIELTLDKDQAAYAPGEYLLSPSSLYVDRNGRLSISPRLRPLVKA